MQERNGNLFDTSAGYLAHGVNCVGVMGAGIAAEFRSRFPDNYNKYRLVCRTYVLTPGESFIVAEKLNGRDVAVANLASQKATGADATYPWLFSSLWSFAEKASRPDMLKRFGGIVAIPEIGCGIGGLEWPTVKKILKTVESVFEDIEFEVWHYKKED